MTKAHKKQLPEFQSIADEAEFWDTHDFTEYADEFKPVRMKFAKPLTEGITIRFDAHTLKTLREEAHQKGMGPTTLIRMWVLERLNRLQAGA